MSHEPLPEIVLDYRSAFGLWQNEQSGAYWAEPTELTHFLPDGYFRGYTEEPLEFASDLEGIAWERDLAQTRYELFDSLGWKIPAVLITQCKYCQRTMHEVYDEVQGEWGSSAYRRIRTFACACGWWNSEDVYQAVAYPEYGDAFNWQAVNSQGCLRAFSVSDSEIPTATLREALARDRADLRHVDPYKLERLVGDVMSDFFNCEVRHVGRAGDGGIDLLLMDGDSPRAIQVKRRSREVAEAVSFVREFVGAMLLGGHISGMFVTTAPRFSAAAESTAALAVSKSLVSRIDLVDADSLLSFIRATPPTPSWQDITPTLESGRPRGAGLK
ncbi:MAG: restriction endonuclease [Pseudolysinimonas sp.]